MSHLATTSFSDQVIGTEPMVKRGVGLFEFYILVIYSFFFLICQDSSTYWWKLKNYKLSQRLKIKKKSNKPLYLMMSICLDIFVRLFLLVDFILLINCPTDEIFLCVWAAVKIFTSIYTILLSGVPVVFNCFSFLSYEC